mmetsp:Transcript_14818/g.42586  ORF Transcript_14818/g.42586 Transcript_14818/m.42586 type:complete len:146 (+) Transcript_14818:67-504(+)
MAKSQQSVDPLTKCSPQTLAVLADIQMYPSLHSQDRQQDAIRAFRKGLRDLERAPDGIHAMSFVLRLVAGRRFQCFHDDEGFGATVRDGRRHTCVREGPFRAACARVADEGAGAHRTAAARGGAAMDDVGQTQRSGAVGRCAAGA